MTEPIYCSVDLEFTGFDPSVDQILEIGFAFFRITEQGAEIMEEWSQIFKPSIEVHPKILGLTGITLAELDQAPEFNEHREFIQNKLRDVILVAHNPTMDVKFLESYGIQLSGQTIDTLELVQFLLPTHHSYNLENLMHYFGIAHTDAHRALGDCRSTIAVLERLLRIYHGFDNGLQEKIVRLAERGQFVWQALLSVPLSGLDQSGNDSLRTNFANLQPLQLNNKKIIVDTEVTNHEARVALGLAKTNALLVVSNNQLVMKLWRAGLVHGMFSSQDIFNPKAFAAFMQLANSNEELRFCLKVIVWQYTNWQTEVVLDLNISFFGGQFKSFITGGDQSPSNHEVVCCDYRTLNYLSADMADKQLVVTGLQDYEHFISSSGPTYLSWNSLLYALRSIYNPETEFGNQELKDAVVVALTSTDLFFGLVYLLLHRSYPQNEYVAMPQVASDQPQIALRLQRAAENLQTKLKAVSDKTDSPELEQQSQFLVNFFDDQPGGRIRWVTIDEQNTVFHDQPLDVASSAQKTLAKFDKVTFTETITQRDLLFYYAERLGLNTEQSDFSEYSSIVDANQLNVHQTPLPDNELVTLVREIAKPVVVALDHPADVKQLYNDHYVELKTIGNLFAQGYSGGGNKMFRNFSIREESTLLATAEFIGRQTTTLSVGSVVVLQPPSLDITHPYIAALLQHWSQRFPHLQSTLELGKLAAALKKLSGRSGFQLEIFNLAAAPELAKLLAK